MSVNALSLALGVPATRMGEIVNCRRGVSPDTATRLAAYFGGSPKVWLRMQLNHDFAVFEKERGRQVRRAVRLPDRPLIHIKP